MIPEEEILANIRDMGYVTCTPRRIRPSYYKTNDGIGTIICVLIRPNHVVPVTNSPDGFTINHTVQISSFTPKENRRPQKFQEHQPGDVQSGITEVDVDCEPLSEEFSVYDLSNGLVLSMKTVVGQINRTKFFTPEGEPMYTVDANPIIKFKKR